MKRLIAFFLCIFIVVSLAPAALAADSNKYSFEASLASKLKELGLLQGVTKVDGTTDFALDSKPTRLEGLVMFIRTLGKAAEAEGYKKTHPFTDVPKWADGYVSYAYDKGLIKGLSDTLFGSGDPLSAEMYLTFMLRALGYNDLYGADFYWNTPWALAAWCGILPPQVIKTDFCRGDAVDITCAALFASIKGAGTKLHERLESQGAFTKEQFSKAFPADPFAYLKRIDSQISSAVSSKSKLGMLSDNVYATECHMIVALNENDGVINVAVSVCVSDGQLQKDNSVENFGVGIGPWLIQLDAKTQELKASFTPNEFADQGLSWDELFPGKSLFRNDEYLAKGMGTVCRNITQTMIDSGAIKYRQPTYEEALAKATARLSEVTKKLEAKPCTVLFGWINGTPHGSYAYLYLIYKPNSAVGEGEIIPLPIPRGDYWSRGLEPNILKLSENGLSLNYSFHFNERLVMYEGLQEEYVIHEKGTYSYTTDLNTGSTSLSIIPD